MTVKLQDVIDAATGAGDGSPVDAVAAFLAESNADGSVDVQALADEAKAEFDGLAENEAPTPEESSALEALADVIDGTQVEIARVDAEGAEKAAHLASLRERVASATATPEPEAAEDDPSVAAVQDEPVVVDAETVETEEVPAEDVVPLAAAATAPRRRVSLASLPRRAEPKPTETKGDASFSMIAAADVRGFSAGQGLATVSDLANAAVAKVSSFPTTPTPGMHLRHNVAQITRKFPKALVASGSNDQAVMNYAGSTDRLKGGNLIAAGGWCAPSETLYDLTPSLASSTVGLLDLPEIAVARGGIRYTQGLDFREVWANSGFQQTEAQAIAGEEKNFYRIPCAAFEEKRADVIGTAVEGGVLQDSAFKELSDQAVEFALATHAHRVNLTSIAQVEAESTAVGPLSVGPSATTALLNGIELQIVDYRYGYRADESLQLEVVLPIWAKTVIRSDLALRSGVDFAAINDAQITAHFAARGAKVQWVIDWQDAFSGVAAGFGALTPIGAFPTTVKAIVYAAGTFVRGRSEVLSLDTIYDSTNIRVNDFVRLFLEESLLIAKRQWHSRVVSIPLAVNGATGAPRNLTVGGAIAP